MQPSSQSDPLIGRRIAHFQIEQRLGHGGMGVVYRATDLRLGRTVAIKILPPHLNEEKPRRERFIQEARAASSLDHPNIGTIHDLVDEPGFDPLIVMAFYEGETLADRLARTPPTLMQSVDLAIQVARGLAEAHSRGIVHRDIKPSNLMITSKGTLKVLDFGLARIAGDARITLTGSVMGTVNYMSPEQASGGAVDARTDVWSLGVVLYEMLASRVPFNADSTPAILYSIVHQPLPDIPMLPVRLRSVLDRALAKDPRDRFADGSQILSALEEVKERLAAESQEVTQAIPVVRPPDPSPQPPARRFRRALLSTALLVALVAAALWLSPQFREMFGFLPEERSVAVLPFSIVGDVGGGPALADGLLETLTSRLTSQETGNTALWVVPASEVRRRNLSSAAEARTAFGANFAVTGSVQQMGQAIRLTINLVNAHTLRQVGAAVLDEPAGDLLKLQDQALAKLSELLEFRVQAASSSAQVGPRQYLDYLRGVGLLARWDKSGNLKQAIGELDKVLAESPRFAEARVAIANAYWLSYQTDHDPAWILKAKQQLQQAQQLDTKVAGVHETLGRIHQATGARDLAVLEFQEALKIDPRSADALTGLARSLESLGRQREAEETFTRGIAARPRSWNAYNNLGAFYFRQKRFAEAEAQFRKVIELTPDNWAAYSNLGNALRSQNKVKEALDAFDKANSISPNYVTYQNAGALNYREGNYRRAAELFTLALTLSDKDYRVWGSVASALRRSGGDRSSIERHTRKAIELAEATLAAAPGDIEARSYLACYYATVGDKAKAGESLELLRNLVPDRGETWVLMAEAYSMLGMRPDAARALEVALSKGITPQSIDKNPELRGLAKK